MGEQTTARAAITWQTAAAAWQADQHALPQWSAVLNTDRLAEFSQEMDERLSQLEADFAAFTTPRSLARGIPRGYHVDETRL